MHDRKRQDGQRLAILPIQLVDHAYLVKLFLFRITVQLTNCLAVITILWYSALLNPFYEKLWSLNSSSPALPA